MLRRAFDFTLAMGLLALGLPVLGFVMLRRRPRMRRVAVQGRDGERVAYRVLRMYPRGHALWALNYLLVLFSVVRGRLALTGARVAWVGRYAPERRSGGIVAVATSRQRDLLRQLSEQARRLALTSHYLQAQNAWSARVTFLRLWFRSLVLLLAAGAAQLRSGAPSHALPYRNQVIDVPPYAWSGARPGLLSPYVLQRRANLRSDGPDGSDQKFALGVPLKAHFALVARFFLSLALGAAPRRIPARVNLLGVEIQNISMATALERIAGMARGLTLQQVAFVNADCLNIAVREPRYQELLTRLPLVLADGIGIRQALKWFMAAGLKENVNGTDLFPQLCRLAADRGLSIYMLGGRPLVAAGAAKAAETIAPGLKIAGARDGYFSEEETAAVIGAINASGADILLVGLGAPRQEIWIREHAAALRPKVAIGVGGLLDFYSGRIPRAPLWMREIGLEWIYRLMQEPQRMWRRYLVGNPLFLWRVWRWSQGPGRCLRADSVQAGALTNAETSQ